MSKNKSLDDLVFEMFKTIIIEQNKVLLKKVANDNNISGEHMLQTYLQPAYYLPVLLKKPQTAIGALIDG
jgi:hypothetical protein